MSAEIYTQTATWTSAAAAGTSAVATQFVRLVEFDWLTITAELQGATGGTLDIYLQQLVGTSTWVDWCHFTQLGAGASAVTYTVAPVASSAIVTVGKGTSPALAAGTCVGGHPGAKLRILQVAGAGTSAGAAQTITVTGWRRRV